jgi:hypothetical protein
MSTGRIAGGWVSRIPVVYPMEKEMRMNTVASANFDQFVIHPSG